MAGKGSVQVKIFPDGTSQVMVKGVKGKRCQDVTKELEKALGSVKKSELTAEYYKKDAEPHIRLG